MEGKGNAKKLKNLPTSDPFPVKLLKPRWSWKEGLSVVEHFMPLNSRTKGLTKNVQALYGIFDIFFILQKGEEGIISKMTIDQLGGGIRQRNAMN